MAVLKVKLIDQLYQRLDRITALTGVSVPDLVVLSINQVLVFKAETGTEPSTCKITTIPTNEITIMLPELMEGITMGFCMEYNVGIEDFINVCVILFLEHYARLMPTLQIMQMRGPNVRIQTEGVRQNVQGN